MRHCKGCGASIDRNKGCFEWDGRFWCGHRCLRKALKDYEKKGQS